MYTNFFHQTPFIAEILQDYKYLRRGGGVFEFKNAQNIILTPPKTWHIYSNEDTYHSKSV